MSPVGRQLTVSFRRRVEESGPFERWRLRRFARLNQEL